MLQMVTKHYDSRVARIVQTGTNIWGVYRKAGKKVETTMLALEHAYMCYRIIEPQKSLKL